MKEALSFPERVCSWCSFWQPYGRISKYQRIRSQAPRTSIEIFMDSRADNTTLVKYFIRTLTRVLSTAVWFFFLTMQNSDRNPGPEQMFGC